MINGPLRCSILDRERPPVDWDEKDMQNGTLDRRVRRTQNLLKQHLIGLLLQKGLEEITVTELVSLADINRGTFYLHYRDIRDLYNQIEAGIVEDFNAILRRSTYPERGRTLAVMEEALRFLKQNTDACIAILRTDGSVFLFKMLEYGRPKTPKEWQLLLGEGAQIDREYFYAFIATGCVGLLRVWLENGMRESPEEMARLAWRLIESCAGR